MRPGADVEALLRRIAAPALGALIRRHRDFHTCEDVLQEALLAAAVQWPVQGIPANPTGWLLTVASRRLTDHLRSEAARHLREQRAAAHETMDEQLAPAADDEDLTAAADSCRCCSCAATPRSPRRRRWRSPSAR